MRNGRYSEKGWATTTLGEVASIERSAVSPANIEAGTLFVGLENMTGDGGFTDVRGVVDKEIASTKFCFGSAHILYGKLRPYLRKIARPDFSGVCSTDILPIRPGHRIDRRFLAHYLRTPDMIALALTRSTGANLPRLSPKILEQFEIPLPPLPEQRRIADILDRADSIRRKRQEAIRLTDEFLRSAFLEMFGDPVTNPKGWDTKPMGRIATFIGGGTPSRKEPSFFDGSICWATSKDMKGEMLRDTQEHITEEAIERSATKLVPAGALLVVVKSKILMHRLPVLLAMVPTCFGQDLKAIVPNDGIPARYLARHMRVGSRALLQQARGVNTEGLTLDHLRGYTVMVPGEDLMKRWERLELAVEKTRGNCNRGLGVARDSFNSLVQRAFRGEL